MDKKDVKQDDINVVIDKKKKVKPKKVKTKNTKGIYIGYGVRVVFFAFLFVVLFGVSYLLTVKSLSFSESKTISYTDGGNIDYKVYLKPNDFYEQPYLGKNMVYVSGLIKNITADFAYQTSFSEPYSGELEYSISGKIQVSDSSGSNIYYTKEYVLLKNTKVKFENLTNKTVNESITIDYDYYNNLANKFKSSYGLDASGNFIITFNVKKTIGELSVSETKSMGMTIPLSQRAISITTDSSTINSTKSITSESKVSLNNKLFVAIAVISFILAVASLLRLLELIFLALGKKSEYDRYLDKVFKEYDRLIVQTNTVPRFDDKNIIKIEKFEELLDARDTFKQPIMYFNVSPHNKCYFYINRGDEVYLTTLKAVDFEKKDKSKKKEKNKTKPHA